MRELARLSFLSLQTVQDELAKLTTADLITSRSNAKHPLYRTLRRMVVEGALRPKPTTRKSRTRNRPSR